MKPAMNKGIFTRLTRPLLQRQSLLSIANVIKHRHAFGLVNNHGATNDDETDGIAAAACRHLLVSDRTRPDSIFNEGIDADISRVRRSSLRILREQERRDSKHNRNQRRIFHKHSEPD
jgi:hypothetical protein